jgi:hypothetical protein
LTTKPWRKSAGEKELWKKEVVAKSVERIPERGMFLTTSDIPVSMSSSLSSIV